MLLGLPIWLVVAVALVAALYASVGHGGASGYLAVLSIATVSTADEMATTALILNLVVASLAFRAFSAEGHVVPKIVMPFAVASVPMAFLGAGIELSERSYSILLAFALAAAAARLCMTVEPPVEGAAMHPPSRPAALGAGAGIGLLSGAVGVGGGIFLGPLLVLKRWSTVQQAAGASAVFILANSAAGLLGRATAGTLAVGTVAPLLGAAFVGGAIGASAGAKRLDSVALRRLLAFVLCIATAKLLL